VIGEDVLDWRELVGFIWRRKVWIVGACIAAMALAVLYCGYVVKPQYEAQVTLQLVEPPALLVSAQPTAAAKAEALRLVENGLRDLVKHPDVLERSSEILRAQGIDVEIAGLVGDMEATVTNKLATLTVRYPDRDLARYLVAAWAEALVDRSSSLSASAAAAIFEAQQAQAGDLEEQYRAAEQALIEFETSARATALAVELDAKQTKLRSLQLVLESTRFDLAHYEASLNSAHADLHELGVDPTELRASLSDADWMSLNHYLSGLLNAYALLLNNGETHVFQIGQDTAPVFVEKRHVNPLQGILADVCRSQAEGSKSVAAETSTHEKATALHLLAIDAAMKRLRIHEEVLRKEIAATESELAVVQSEVVAVEQQRTILKDKLNVLRQMYTEMIKAVEHQRISSSTGYVKLTMLTPASVGYTPIAPDMKRTVGLAALVSLFFSTVLVLFVEVYRWPGSSVRYNVER
jgi:uncharacterized protein involved in exopolysaccharide biosynthesis